jgi:hypothetical protein
MGREQKSAISGPEAPPLFTRLRDGLFANLYDLISDAGNVSIYVLGGLWLWELLAMITFPLAASTAQIVRRRRSNPSTVTAPPRVAGSLPTSSTPLHLLMALFPSWRRAVRL